MPSERPVNDGTQYVLPKDAAHMLFLDGVYVHDGVRGFAFHCTKAPTVEQLTELLNYRCPLRASGLPAFWKGGLERDEDNSYLTLDGLDEDPMQDIHSHPVTYPIAMGPQRGRKVSASCSRP